MDHLQQAGYLLSLINKFIFTYLFRMTTFSILFFSQHYHIFPTLQYGQYLKLFPSGQDDFLSSINFITEI